MCDGVIQSKWAADREHPITDLYRLGIAHLRNRQVTAGLDSNHRKICFLVAADDFGLILRLVFQADCDLRGLIDHVMIRQNIARPIDDESGAETAYLLITVRQVGGAEEIEEIERIKLSGILIAVALATVPRRILGSGFGTDVHDGRRQVCGDLRERIGQRNRIGNDNGLCFLFARFDPTGDDSPYHNTDRECRKNQGEIKQSLLCHD